MRSSGRTASPKGWNGADQFWHGCFSDLPALYRIGNLQSGLGGYLSPRGDARPSTSRSLTGAVMALLGGLVPDGSVLDQTRWYFGLWAVLAAALLLLTVYLTAASRPRHVADAACWRRARCWCSSRSSRPTRVGVALVGRACGLGAAVSHSSPARCSAWAVAARTYPLLILLALVLLGVRTGR